MHARVVLALMVGVILGTIISFGIIVENTRVIHLGNRYAVISFFGVEREYR